MTTITALPDAPSRTDPATFSAKSDALLGALATFVSETNTVAGEVNANAVSAAADAISTAADAIATAADAVATAADAATSTAQAASVLAMDKRYLGSFAVAPALDNQGDPLATGAVYYDTALAKVRTWTGSAWVEGIASVAGVASVNGANGAVTVQETLVSGTNIKTLGSTSLLGSGDIAIKTLDGVSLLGSGNIQSSPGALLYAAQFSSL